MQYSINRTEILVSSFRWEYELLLTYIGCCCDQIIVVLEHGRLLVFFLLFRFLLLFLNVVLPTLFPCITVGFDTLSLVVLFLSPTVLCNLLEF